MAGFDPMFHPNSGWYRRPASALPGSAADVQARNLAAHRCIVFRLREKGVRLPSAEVIAHHFFEGALVCTDEYTAPQWHAVLYALPDGTRGIIGLHDVALKRSRGGFRQYQGVEWDERALNRWPQTWFTAPSHEAGVAVLMSMDV